MASSQVFGTKTFCIITGGSKGIGRAIAKALSSKISTDSVIILTGRSETDLSESQRQVQSIAPGVQVRVVTADLSNTATFSNVLGELTKDVDPSDFQHVILINNAGSLWDISRYLRQTNVSDVESLQEFMFLNITSALLLTSRFLTMFPKKDNFRRTIINVSSLVALQPQISWGVYCVGKAARDMLFRTIAAEEPDVRILNYAPGPVDTAMYRDICQNSVDTGVREMMIGVEKSNNLVKTDETAATLIRFLGEDKYESGAHVDYFDVKE